MKKLLFIFFALVLPLMASAYDEQHFNTEINNIYYTFNTSDLTASVSYKAHFINYYTTVNKGEVEYDKIYSDYTGDVVIPNEVTYNDITYTVTSIGSQAFVACSGLTSVNIPNSVTSICQNAFAGCSGLTSLIIGKGVAYIDIFAFVYCSGLTSIMVDGDNPKYDSRNNCDAIIDSNNQLILGCKNTVIPNSVTSIGEYAFCDCCDLASITIPNSVNSIGNNAFVNCSGLTSIVLQIEDPCKISDCVFPSDIYTTATLTVPYGTKSLYESTDGWKNFQNIVEAPSPKRTIHVATAGTLPDLIGDDKDLIEELTLTGELNGTDFYFIREMAGDKVSYGMLMGSPTLVRHHSSEGILKSLDISNARIVQGGEYYNYINYWDAYLGLSTSDNKITTGLFTEMHLETIILPNNVVYIGGKNYKYNYAHDLVEGYTGAFPESLASITIPNSVTSIGGYAFSNCQSMTSIVSQIENPFEISENVFPYYIYSTATLTVPYGTKSLYESTEGWKRFQNIVEAPSPKRTIHVSTAGSLPDLISEEEKYQIEELTLTGELNGTDFKFINEMAGKSVSFVYYGPNDCEIINNKTNGLLRMLNISKASIVGGGGAYDWDNWGEAIGLITLDNVITDRLFANTSLESVLLPNNVVSISQSVFNGCSSLKSITIPNSVKSIGSKAFSGCSSLTSVIIGNGVTSIGNAFSNCNNLIEMTLSQAAYDNGIPESVTKFTTYSKNPMRVEVVSKGVVSATMKIYPIDEQGNTNENNCYTVTTSGQTPGQYIRWKLDYENYGIISEKTEGILILETLPAQAMSTTKARLSAIVNEADDDQHFGFEWLRHNAPDDMVPNKVLAPLYDGHIIGSLSGLNPDIYYKYRSFYKSDSGETIYGNWVTFLTGDANVFFEPEAHTKDATEVTSVSAQLSGVWVEGTEDIDERGFEYWTVPVSNTRAVGNDVKRVVVSGNNSSTTIEGLKTGADYAYRSYLKTASGTTYGEEKTFKTILIGDVNGDKKVNKDDLDAIVSHIMGDTPQGFNKKAADINEDDKVDAVDVVKLVNAINGK